MMRQVAKRVAVQGLGAKAGARSVLVARAMSSSLDDKKKGAEAAYIKAQEAKRMAEAKAKFEALMKSENSEEKQELIEMLGAWMIFRCLTRFFCFDITTLITNRFTPHFALLHL